MKALKIVLLSLFSILALLLVTSFFLKSTLKVTKSIEVKADLDAVYSYLGDFNNMQEWSPWYAMDTAQKSSVEGQAGLVGSFLKWESSNGEVGNGVLTRKENQEGKGFINEMKMEGMDNVVNDVWQFEPTATGTKITWTVEGDMGNQPWMKFIALMIDYKMNEIMPDGLNKMKERLESMPAAPAVSDEELSQPINGFETQVKMSDEAKILYMHKTIKISEFETEFGNMMMAITAYMTKKNIKQSAPPMTIFYTWSEEKNECEIDAAIPVDKEITGEGEIKYKALPSIKMMAITYKGPYDKKQPVYDSAMQLLEQKKVMADEGPREIYITDPMTEKDMSKWTTEIQFPIK